MKGLFRIIRQQSMLEKMLDESFQAVIIPGDESKIRGNLGKDHWLRPRAALVELNDDFSDEAAQINFHGFSPGILDFVMKLYGRKLSVYDGKVKSKLILWQSRNQGVAESFNSVRKEEQGERRLPLSSISHPGIAQG
jgi:hypothetical protein